MDLKLNVQMKKRNSFQHKSSYSYCKWKKKIFLAILISFCFGSLLVMQIQYTKIKMLIPLGLSSSSSSSSTTVSPYPKIAFLFIARNRLPLDVVWDAFFKADKEERFSIFIHSRPGFLFNKATTKSAYFYGRQISDSIQVDWGEATMILAERILLKNALTDSSNQRFVFLSDSCIPLYNFSYTYDYIMSTTNSFVDSFADTKDGRYNPKMNPVVPVHNWRKGSQWVVLTTKHAEVVVKDEAVFTIFQQHCKRKSLPEFWRDRPVPADTSKEHNCIPDEHYVQTLLAQEGLEGELTRRTLTHTSWDLSTLTQRERRGWHPMTYRLSDATPMLIKSIKDIDNVYYETEYRREWCTSKGKPSPCFLFARKFTRPAALQLFNMSVLGASDEGSS